MNQKAVRWRQRFSNLKKALALLKEAVSNEGLNRLEQEGLIQRFEYSFELAWKTMKDFLESRGVDAIFPRDVVKAGFSTGLIVDGELWLEMLEGRNRLSHTYNEETFLFAVRKIRQEYFPQLILLESRLTEELEKPDG